VRVLLDTHVWIWRLLEPERLPSGLADVLGDPTTEICLSPISVWETLVLARKGRLRLEPSPSEWVRAALRHSQPLMIPVTHAIAIESESLEGYTATDPADRFLVASAIVEGLAMATTDRAMLSYSALDLVG
jgi:PIN domain nuclease of toxin-antitoxin system